MPKWMQPLDFFFNKVIPKKLLVIIFATVFAFMGIISGGQWLIVAGAYAGINFGQKALERLTHGNRYIGDDSSRSGDGGSRNRRVHLDAQESRETVD